MTTAPDPSAAPSKFLLALEARAFFELGAYVAAWPLYNLAAKGDGHPVMTLPGLAADDPSTYALRSFLRGRDYRAHGWHVGRNTGKVELLEPLLERLHKLNSRYGRPVSLIGWSAGGLFARELAKQAPKAVRQVITLGSPFTGHPRASNARRVYEWLSGKKDDDPALSERLRGTPPVPTTCIFTRTDGVVPWQRCVEVPGDRVENIEVEGSHSGLGHNPVVLFAIADRLAQEEGQWTPFDRRGFRSLFYPDPQRRASRLAPAE
jgi:pimeloyl-ACP methyl ester carboxylesterase